MFLKKLSRLTSFIFTVTLIATSLWTPTIVAEESVPIYKPPVQGAPTHRVGAGSRGIISKSPELRDNTQEKTPILALLVPNHVGRTGNPQPSLYWSISEVVKEPVIFTLVYADPLAFGNSTNSLIETRVDASQKGIHSVNLAKYGTTLRAKVEYRWSVSIITNPREPSLNIVAEGLLIYIPPTRELEARLANAQTTQHPFIYAGTGYWYDALDSLSTAIAQDPMNSTLRQQRATLLEQVKLRLAQVGDSSEFIASEIQN